MISRAHLHAPDGHDGITHPLYIGKREREGGVREGGSEGEKVEEREGGREGRWRRGRERRWRRGRRGRERRWREGGRER